MRRGRHVAALAEPVLVEDIEWFASMEDERRLLRSLIALNDPTLFDILAVTETDGEGRWLTCLAEEEVSA